MKHIKTFENKNQTIWLLAEAEGNYMYTVQAFDNEKNAKLFTLNYIDDYREHYYAEEQPDPFIDIENALDWINNKLMENQSRLELIEIKNISTSKIEPNNRVKEYIEMLKNGINPSEVRKFNL